MAAEFEACQGILQALGDANRQHLMLEMLRIGQWGGVRTAELPATELLLERLERLDLADKL